MLKYTIETLKDMGYTKAGENKGIETWDNFHSTLPIKDSNDSGYIFQFNPAVKEEPIGVIFATKELLEVIISGHKEEL
jgi:hypothetical protein